MVPNPDNRSRRFLSAQELSRCQPRRSFGPVESFAEGQWPMIRARLEWEGWSHSQVEQVHDQLRRGWPLAMARRNVAVISGRCPLAARREG
jgi:hypothetical protein